MRSLLFFLFLIFFRAVKSTGKKAFEIMIQTAKNQSTSIDLEQIDYVVN